MSVLSGYTGLAVLCAPWETLVLIPDLLEDEKVSQILFHSICFSLSEGHREGFSACQRR